MKPAYIGVAAVIIVGGIGLWFASPREASQAVTASEKESSSGSLAALVQRGGSWTCSVTHSSDQDSTKGKVYVSDGKIRGDFTSTVPNVGPVESHMIADGQSVYVWSSMMQSGMKMPQTETGGKDSAMNHQDFYNQDYDYTCEPWTTDASMFAVPSDVTFNDMSHMMPPATPSSAAGAPAGLNCAMCDQAPTAEAKAACRSALKCQ